MMSKPHLLAESLRRGKPALNNHVVPERSLLLSQTDDENSETEDIASVNHSRFEDDGKDGHAPSIRKRSLSDVRDPALTCACPCTEISPPPFFQTKLPATLTFMERLVILKGLIVPYVLPLFLVYWA